MQKFSTLPIKQKLTLLIMGVSTAVVVLACALLFVMDMVSFRKNLISESETIGVIIGKNVTAALVFQDKDAALESLQALESQPNVIAGSILSENGKLFAQYVRAGSDELLLPVITAPGIQIVNNYILNLQPIFLENEQIGFTFLQTDLRVMYARIWWYGGVILTVLLISFLAAFLLTTNIQKLISEPILTLTQKVKTGEMEEKYFATTDGDNRDEIGQLTTSFNKMMEDLQEQNKALKQSEENLARSNRIIAGLSHASARIETADTVNEIVKILGRELKELDFFCFIGDIDLQSREIITRYTSFAPTLINRAEKLAGFKLEGYKIPLERFEYHDTLFYNKKPVFIPDLTRDIRLALPQLPDVLVDQILKLLGFKRELPSISVPMLVEEKIIGLLSVWGNGLREEDIPAMKVFGSQVTTAIEKNQLLNQVKDELKERLKFEEELKKSEKEYRSIFESFTDIYYRTNEKMEITVISPSVKDLGGYDPEELIGMKAHEFYFDSQERDYFVKSLKKHGFVSDFEMKLKKKNGDMVHTSANVRTILNEHGKIIGLEGVIRDITSRKTAERALQKAHDELEIKVEERTLELKEMYDDKEKFIARVSHDLRTPIAAILGYSQLLSDEKWGKLKKEQSEKIEKVISHTYHLDKIVDSLLNVFKIDSKAVAANKKRLKLENIINEAISQTSGILTAKSQSINFINNAGEIEVLTEEDSLVKVISNLIENASKYNTDEGRVIIVTEVSKSNIIVEVKDTGIGLAKEDLNYIFDEFFRARKGGELRIQGTGLGLTIVKKYIEHLGGKIWAESKGLGKGSSFFFTLPIMEKE